MDSTSPTLASVVGLTSDLSDAVETITLVLVERFFRPMPKPGFAGTNGRTFLAEEGRTRHFDDGESGRHGLVESTAARWGYPG